MKVIERMNAVAKALAEKGIAKNQKNTSQGWVFRGIDDVLNTLSHILSDNGLLIVPDVTDCNQSQIQTKNGGFMTHTILNVNYHFICTEDDERFTVAAIGENMDSSDKSINKALTAAYKYMLFQTFCIPLVGDDADSASPETAEKDDKPEPVQDDGKEWLNQSDFDKEHDRIVNNLVGGMKPMEIIKELRKDYKVAKKWLAEIEALQGEAYAVEQGQSHRTEQQEDYGDIENQDVPF